MEWSQVFEMGNNPKQYSTEQLREAMRMITAHKMWRGPYFPIKAELADRACREWVREDVFGHTFTGSAQ